MSASTWREWFYDKLVSGQTAGYEWGVFDGSRRIAICDADSAQIIGQLHTFARWLVAMDDPEDVLGRADRQRVTLDQIIEEARVSLEAD